MGGSSSLRAAKLAGATLAAMLAGASIAHAQDGVAPGEVDFTDPNTVLRQPERSSVDFAVRDDAAPRFAPANPDGEDQGPRRLELSLAAGIGDTPVDVSIAQRASLGADDNGDLNRRGAGSEFRIGRGLVRERDNDGSRSAVYAFVASDDEALTWQPGARTDLGGRESSFALQDRAEIGDMSAGVTYEHNGIQASLAYVEREASTTIGNQTYSQDESFAGITITMRRR